ncbi:MAG: hypothetical protein M1114_01745 [Candidatus Dependentiae bacterium]|nr:hypothetical protein [Candidatus Dependentiae bacterium]
MYFLFFSMLLSLTFNSIVAQEEAQSEIPSANESNSRKKIYELGDNFVDNIFTKYPELNNIIKAHEFAEKHNDHDLKIKAILLLGNNNIDKRGAAQVIAKKLDANIIATDISTFDCDALLSIEQRLSNEIRQSKENGVHQVILVNGFNEHFSDCAASRLRCLIDRFEWDKDVTFILTADERQQLSDRLFSRFLRCIVKF